MARKILVVDDERPTVRLVEINLQRAGYDVVTAYDGVEALEKVRAEKPDLLVLDIMMPRMDGFEVLRKLQTDPATRDIPVILLTAKATDAAIFRGWQSGISGYITKPFEPRDLLDGIERIFESLDVETGFDGSEWEV